MNRRSYAVRLPHEWRASYREIVKEYFRRAAQSRAEQYRAWAVFVVLP